MIAKKITPKLFKAINKYGVDISVYRLEVNEFKEPLGEVLVTSFKGLYSESNHSINENTKDSGIVKKDKVYKITALINEDTSIVSDGDILKIKDMKFKVINKSNSNMLDVYYDITIKRY